MKVLPFRIPKPELDALVYQEDHETVFYDKFHQHKEVQVSYIEDGEGTLIVGDTINDYKAGDILVIGSNLPHVFKSNVIGNQKSHMHSIFFTNDAFGEAFFGLEELRALRPFFKRATNGFKVSSQHPRTASLFLAMKTASKLDRFIYLLEIMKILSRSKYKALSSFIYEKTYTDVEGKRMRDVMEYTMNNFHHNISLETIAMVAAMTKNAFCKYFKKRTNKTYFQFLNELRIENACKLLLSDNDFSIAEVADRSGFNNISNFNRQFKSVKNMVPSTYKKNKAL